MLTLTEGAAAHLADLLTEMNCSDGTAVRFRCQADGPVLSLDNLNPGDASFVHEGRMVLVLDEATARILREQTLDVQETVNGPRLHVAHSAKAPRRLFAGSAEHPPVAGR